MSDAIIRSVTELLNEEKWTRATLNSYTIHNFQELDEVIIKIQDGKLKTEVKTLCEEHLQHTKNSIIALYIAGVLALSRQSIDDSSLITLINIFSDNHKWAIVEYLANRILVFGENKTALRTLAECYDNENEEEKKYEILERLIKVDHEEADIVKHFAERKEKSGEIAEAVDYYKKAIHRFIQKKSFANVKEIWHKLIEYAPEETDFFFHVEKKIGKAISTDKASHLLEEMYTYFKKTENWDKAIEILKRVLDYDPKNANARKEIIECFQKKFESHSQLEEYIKLSNLTQSWRNVHDAIADFEKHIAFDEGNFVGHKTWGVGVITKIMDDEITIDFARKRGHKMSLKMAVNALSTFPKDHIWVLKAVLKKEELREKIKSDLPWSLKTIIKSFDNAADLKKIKTELVPSILTVNEWTSWSSQAREILKTDSSFGNLPDKLDQYVVRENPISYEEKTYNKFKAQKNYFSRLSIFFEFIENEDISIDSDFFTEIFDYFANYVKSYTNVNEYVVSSFLLLRKIIKRYPFLNPGLDMDFSGLFSQIESVEEVFSKIDNTDIRKDFVELIKDYREDWKAIYLSLIPVYLSKYLVDQLTEHDCFEEVKKLFIDIVDNCRENREAFIWLVRNYSDSASLKTFSLNYEKILIGMIHLLDISYREITNKKEVSFNRKINKQIQSYLFGDSRVHNYFSEKGPESISRLFTLISDIKDMDPKIKVDLKQEIIDKHPDFKFYGDNEKEVVTRTLYVTSESYNRKQKQLKHILEAEIPENSKEIGAAIALGDLRENAEYKAAKEKQDMLNNQANKIKEELEKSQLFDPQNVNTSSISFGNKVVLHNLETNEEEDYTILGPWESEPEKNIISYLSPFGSALLNHKEKEELSFAINERKYHYRVEKISISDLM